MLDRVFYYGVRVCYWVFVIVLNLFTAGAFMFSRLEEMLADLQVEWLSDIKHGVYDMAVVYDGYFYSKSSEVSDYITSMCTPLSFSMEQGCELLLIFAVTSIVVFGLALTAYAQVLYDEKGFEGYMKRKRVRARRLERLKRKAEEMEF